MRDLRKDLDICYKATPGPWKRNEKPSFGDWWVYVGGQHICLLPADKKGTHFGEMFKANAEFIAAAREGWPHAIERAIKAEAENAKLKEIVKRMRLDVCRLEYGDDFDSCSTQEREGCGSCAYLNNFETAYLAELDKEGE